MGGEAGKSVLKGPVPGNYTNRSGQNGSGSRNWVGITVDLVDFYHSVSHVA